MPGAALAQVITYVDGFNLYYGLRHAYGRKYLWLDLELLVTRLLTGYQHLERVRYFTAPRREDPDGQFRQRTYWGALEAQGPRVEIVNGRFQEKSMWCRQCGNRWTTYEEKETDVSIGIAMIEDAAYRHFETALVVSGDSDLAPAIRAVKRIHPQSRVVVAFPPRRHSDELRTVADHASRSGRPTSGTRSCLTPSGTSGDGYSPARVVGTNKRLARLGVEWTARHTARQQRARSSESATVYRSGPVRTTYQPPPRTIYRDRCDHCGAPRRHGANSSTMGPGTTERRGRRSGRGGRDDPPASRSACYPGRSAGAFPFPLGDRPGGSRRGLTPAHVQAISAAS